MQYTPYARDMMELIKQLTSGSIAPDVYKQKRAELEQKYKSKDTKVQISHDEKPYNKLNELPEFENDDAMITYLEQLAKKDPKMPNNNTEITKPKRKRTQCQTNTSN